MCPPNTKMNSVLTLIIDSKSFLFYYCIKIILFHSDRWAEMHQEQNWETMKNNFDVIFSPHDFLNVIFIFVWSSKIKGKSLRLCWDVQVNSSDKIWIVFWNMIEVIMGRNREIVRNYKSVADILKRKKKLFKFFF